MNKLIFAIILILCSRITQAQTGCTGTYPNPLDVCGTGTTINNTRHITGGAYSSLHPFQADTANTEYLLDGDMTANGTGIQITAAPVAINLNGHRITYNNMSTSTGYYGPNGGIVTAASNLNNGGPATAGVGISNGYIVQAPSQTTFASAINNSQTSIPVTNGAVFNVGEYLIAFSSQSDQTINVEHMLITGITGNTLTVTRGSDDTTAAVHDNTAVVFSSRGAGLGYEPAASEYGAYGGIGNNAICTKPYIINYTQVDSINATYSGLDVSGFVFGADHTAISNCTFTDTMNYGWVTYRGNGIYAIETYGDYLVANGNTIINTRNRGIGGGNNSNIFNNTISVKSVCTNSGAVTLGDNSVMHDNNITGRGEAPMGVEVGASPGIQIYNNTMDMQITQLGAEYGSSTYPGPSTPTAAGEFAVGIRSTTGIQNLSIFDNTITVRSFSNYSATYSPTGEPVVISGGDVAKGLMLGLRYSNESISAYGNTITALDADGTGMAIGISCSANIDNRYAYSIVPNGGYYVPQPDFRPALNIYNNVVTSNIMNLAIGDEYAGCDGFPAIYNNTWIKTGSFDSYATFGIGLGFYNGPAYAWILGSSYSGGAAESSQAFNFGEQTITNTAFRGMNIIFGGVNSNMAYLRYAESNSGGTTGSATPIISTLSLSSQVLPLVTGGGAWFSPMTISSRRN